MSDQEHGPYFDEFSKECFDGGYRGPTPRGLPILEKRPDFSSFSTVRENNTITIKLLDSGYLVRYNNKEHAATDTTALDAILKKILHEHE